MDQETEEYLSSSSDSDSSSSSSESQYMQTDVPKAITEQELQELTEQLNSIKSNLLINPYDLHSTVKLLHLLETLSDHKEEYHLELNIRRTEASSIFCLPEIIWKRWITDCIKEKGDKTELNNFVKRASLDGYFPDVWYLYLKFLLEERETDLEELFESALVQVSMDPLKAAPIWALYRQFNSSADKITSLYKRQLAIPHFTIETTWEETQSYFPVTERPTDIYKKSFSEIESRMKNEEAILSDPNNINGWIDYLKKIKLEGRSELIRNVYERAVQHFYNNFCEDKQFEQCLIAISMDYLQYLRSNFNVRPIIMALALRSSRQLPTCYEIIKERLLIEEFHNIPLEKLHEIVHGCSDYRMMVEWLNIVRRRYMDEKNPLSKEQLEAYFYKFTESSPEWQIWLEMYLAEIYATNNYSRSVDIWENILKVDSKNPSTYLSYVDFIKKYCSNEKKGSAVISVFKRALSSCTENDSIIAEYRNWVDRNVSVDVKMDMENRLLKYEKSPFEYLNYQSSISVVDEPQVTELKRKNDDEKMKPKKKKVDKIPESPKVVTIFLNNLSFTVNPTSISEFFAQHNINVIDIRLVKRDDGACKGFAYADIDNADLETCLKLDRSMIDGRMMFISENKRKSFVPNTPTAPGNTSTNGGQMKAKIVPRQLQKKRLIAKPSEEKAVVDGENRLVEIKTEESKSKKTNDDFRKLFLK